MIWLRNTSALFIIKWSLLYVPIVVNLLFFLSVILLIHLQARRLPSTIRALAFTLNKSNFIGEVLHQIRCGLLIFD